MKKALDTVGHEVIFKNTLHTKEGILCNHFRVLITSRILIGTGVMQETLSPAETLLSDISATIKDFIPKVYILTIK